MLYFSPGCSHGLLTSVAFPAAPNKNLNLYITFPFACIETGNVRIQPWQRVKSFCLQLCSQDHLSSNGEKGYAVRNVGSLWLLQSTAQWDHIAQLRDILSCFKYLQRWRTHCLSGQPVTGFVQSHNGKSFSSSSLSFFCCLFPSPCNTVKSLFSLHPSSHWVIPGNIVRSFFLRLNEPRSQNPFCMPQMDWYWMSVTNQHERAVFAPTIGMARTLAPLKTLKLNSSH